MTPIIDAILNGSDPLSVVINADVYEIPVESGQILTVVLVPVMNLWRILALFQLKQRTTHIV